MSSNVAMPPRAASALGAAWTRRSGARDRRSGLGLAGLKHVAAGCLFALAAGVNGWDWLAGDLMPPGDFPGYAAQVQYVRDALLEHGRVPLWCVHCYGGTTNFTSNLKEYVAFPFAVALEPVLATKVAFLVLRIAAALGIYALVVRWFAAPAVGIAAGYAYGFGTFANFQFENLDAALSAALLPPILLATLALLARGGARSAIALGALAACSFANNWVHAASVPLAMALLVWLRPWRTGSSPGAPALRAIGAATGVFVAFAASQLAWMASDVHNHQLIPPERAAGEREQWISRSPFLFVNRANVLGPWLAEHHPPGLDLAALDGDRRYLGVVVLALTAAGAVAARRDAQLLRWFGVAGPALFGIYWLSLGPRTLLWEVAESLGGSAERQAAASTALRAVAAAGALAAAAIAIAARALRRDTRAARTGAGLLLGGALLAFFPTASLWSACAAVLPWLELQRSPGHFFDVAHFWLALLFALALLALQRRIARPSLAPWIAAAATAAVVADYWPSRSAFAAGAPMESLRRASELVRSLPGEDGTLRIGAGMPFPSYMPAASWIAAQGAVGHAWGWLSWRSGAHWGDLIDPAIGAASPGDPNRRTAAESEAASLHPLFEVARVRYWLRSSSAPPLPQPWQRVRSDRAVAIWELPAVSPFAAGFRDAWLADESADAALVARATARNALVVSGPEAERFASRGEGAARNARATRVPVTYRRPQPEHIALEVEAGAEPALIFVSEGYHPWWRASVDSAPAPVLRAQIALLAVPVGPGSHRIDLHFAPPRLMAAADRVTALAWIALALGAPLALWRHARQGSR